MKNLTVTLTLLLLICAAGVSQIGYKPMNGYYDYKGNIRFSDSNFLDSVTYNPSQGMFLGIDSTGVSVTGYSRVITTTGGGSLKGVGQANRAAFWDSSDSLKVISGIRAIADSGTLQLNGVGKTALVTAEDKQISVGGNLIRETSSTLSFDIASEAGKSIAMMPADVLAMEITSTAVNIGNAVKKLDVKIQALNDTAMYVDKTDNGSVGIGTFPQNRLHIEGASGATETLIRLDNPAEVATAGETVNITNAPTGSSSVVKYLKIDIDGTEYLIMLLAAP